MAYLTTLSTMRYLTIASIKGSLIALKTTGFPTIASTKEFLTIWSITAHLIMKNTKVPLIFAGGEANHNLAIIWELKIKSNQKIQEQIHTVIAHQYQIILHNF